MLVQCADQWIDPSKITRITDLLVGKTSRISFPGYTVDCKGTAAEVAAYFNSIELRLGERVGLNLQKIVEDNNELRAVRQLLEDRVTLLEAELNARKALIG